MKYKEKVVTVLGLGRMGQSIIDTLSKEDHNIIAVDQNKEKIENVAGAVAKAIVGDFTDIKLLKALDVKNTDIVIVGVGTNLESSIMTCMLLKELETPYIIAKAKNMQHKKVLEKIGVNKVVLPEAEMGARIAINILNSDKLNYVEYNTDYTIVELEPKQEWIDKSLLELHLRRNEGINVIAVKKKNDYGQINVAPTAEYVIKKDDIIVGITTSDKLTF